MSHALGFDAEQLGRLGSDYEFHQIAKLTSRKTCAHIM